MARRQVSKMLLGLELPPPAFPRLLSCRHTSSPQWLRVPFRDLLGLPGPVMGLLLLVGLQGFPSFISCPLRNGDQNPENPAPGKEARPCPSGSRAQHPFIIYSEVSADTMRHARPRSVSAAKALLQPPRVPRASQPRPPAQRACRPHFYGRHHHNRSSNSNKGHHELSICCVLGTAGM